VEQYAVTGALLGIVIVSKVLVAILGAPKNSIKLAMVPISHVEMDVWGSFSAALRSFDAKVL